MPSYGNMGHCAIDHCLGGPGHDGLLIVCPRPIPESCLKSEHKSLKVRVCLIAHIQSRARSRAHAHGRTIERPSFAQMFLGHRNSVLAWNVGAARGRSVQQTSLAATADLAVAPPDSPAPQSHGSSRFGATAARASEPRQLALQSHDSSRLRATAARASKPRHQIIQRLSCLWSWPRLQSTPPRARRVHTPGYPSPPACPAHK